MTKVLTESNAYLSRLTRSKDKEWGAGEIINNKLWIGSLLDARMFEELKKRKIDTVLTCARGLFVFGKGAKNKPDFIKKRAVLKIADHPTQVILSDKVMGRAIAFIQDSMSDPDSRILVHCASGISRSVSMVLAYLISEHKDITNVDDALAFVRKNRPQANPNLGFRFQLDQFTESKCDLTSARKKYLALMKNDDTNPILISIKQRAEASEIMRILLDIEGSIVEKEEKDVLSDLGKRIDNIIAKMNSSVCCDRPAMSIIKSAKSKYKSILRKRSENVFAQ